MALEVVFPQHVSNRVFHMKQKFHFQGLHPKRNKSRCPREMCTSFTVPVCTRTKSEVEMPSTEQWMYDCGLEILGRMIQSLRAVQRLQFCGSTSACFLLKCEDPRKMLALTLKPGMVLHVCNSTTERQRQEGPWVLLVSRCS